METNLQRKPEGGLRMYKLLLLAVLSGMVVLFVKTVVSARGLAITDGGARAQAILAHRAYAWWLFGTTLGFIALVEIKRMLFGGVIRDWLFYTHTPFAILFFLVLCSIVAKFDGVRYSYHPWLGYASALFFVPTVLTGVPMILRMSA